MDEKLEDELAELNEEILYNKGCVQNMAQMHLNFDDPDVSGWAQAALDEVNEAANRSNYKTRRLRERLDFMLTGSEASSIMGAADPLRRTSSGKSTRLPHPGRETRPGELQPLPPGTVVYMNIPCMQFIIIFFFCELKITTT